MGENERDGVCTLDMSQPPQDGGDDQDDEGAQPMPLSRDAILGMDDLPIQEVLVPEWEVNGRPSTVCIRTLTGIERDRLAISIKDGQGGGQSPILRVRARLVALTACDAQGARLFSDEDVDALNDKNAAALDRLFAAAQKMNGLTGEAVEEMVEN